MSSWRGFTDKDCGALSASGDLTNVPLGILPIGATEQHGNFLPVGMDWIVATETAVAVGRRLGAYVLPTIPIGTSMEHRGSRGTIWVRPATLAALVEDVSDSAAVWGLTRLAIISGHGGNFILGPTVRQLNTEKPDRRVILVPERVIHGADMPSGDLHAGTTETSIGCHLLGVDPPGREADSVPTSAREELNHTPLLELSPNGVWGQPSKATPELGKQELDARIDRITDYLRTVFPERARPTGAGG